MKKKDSSTGNNNTYQKEQAKHLKRIRSFIKGAKSRGYLFYNTKIPKSLIISVGTPEYTSPKTVKNPTAVTVKRLEKITPETLYKKAIWIDPETGEIFSGEEGRAIENKRRAQKAAETKRRKKQEKERPPEKPQPPPDTPPYYRIFDRIRDYIDTLVSYTDSWQVLESVKRARGRDLMRLFEDCLGEHEANETLHEYAAYLERNASEISEIIVSIDHDSKEGAINSNIGKLESILNQGPLSALQRDAYHSDEFDYVVEPAEVED